MLRFLTAGESHGPCLTAIVEGLPAGLAVDAEAIDRELARRQSGYGRGERMHIEQDRAEIQKRFSYHAPKDTQPERYIHIRDSAKRLAVLLHAHCPPSRERSLALTKLEESVMWANASIARNE